MAAPQKNFARIGEQTLQKMDKMNAEVPMASPCHTLPQPLIPFDPPLTSLRK
jgi:hypothetical protein